MNAVFPVRVLCCTSSAIIVVLIHYCCLFVQPLCHTAAISPIVYFIYYIARNPVIANMSDGKSPRPPVSVMIGRQLDQEKIDVLSKRVEGLIDSNTGLRTSAERNEKDTHDIVIYFQREMEMKDDIIGRLNEELVKKEGQTRAEADRLKEKYETEMVDFKKDSVTLIEDLRLKLDKADSELSGLESYKRDKDAHDAKLAELEENLAKEKQQSIVALENQERKFLENKSQMIKDLEEKKQVFHEAALREARAAMDAESKKLVIDNKRICEELKFHNVISYEYQVEKDRLEAALTTTKRDVSLMTEKEEEYARQNYLKTKEIKSLRERVEQLEKAQMTSIERFKTRTKELKKTIQKDLEEATLDATGLRRLIMIKNKELRHIKSLAATVLEQRSEMEEFFLDSLSEVQDIVRKQKQLSAASNQHNLTKRKAEGVRKWNKGGSSAKSGTFPKIKTNDLHRLDERGTHQSNIPTDINQKVFIKDLSWEDKELVLRLLFAKMNGLHKTVNMALDATNREAEFDDGDGSADETAAVFISEGKGVPDAMNMDGGEFDFDCNGESEMNLV